MATVYTAVRIEEDVFKFLKAQANKEGRTLSGMINKYLSDSKNRVENQKRKEEL